jgi:hypothetical protein
MPTTGRAGQFIAALFGRASVDSAGPAKDLYAELYLPDARAPLAA